MMFIPQLRALFRKNFILWKRSYILSLIEIIIPPLFAAFLFVIRGISHITYYPEASHVSDLSLYKLNSQPLLTVNATKIGDYTVPLPLFKNCSGDGGGFIALYPQSSPLVTKLEQYITGVYPSFFNTTVAVKYMSDAEINSYIASSDYGSTSDKRICMGITFTNAEGPQYAYNIRVNYTAGTLGNSDAPSPNVPTWSRFERQAQSNLENYLTSGILQIQTWIDNFILQTETLNPSAKIDVEMASVTTPKDQSDSMPSVLDSALHYLICFPLIVPFLRMVAFLVTEKEKKIKEGMRIMGLRNVPYYASWIIQYLSIYTFISLIFAGFTTNMKSAFGNSSFGIIFLWYWLFCICLIGLAFFISAFFSKARTGILSAMVLFFLLAFVAIPFDNIENPTVAAKACASLSPLAAMTFASKLILNFEANQLGATTATMRIEYTSYTISTAFGFLVLDFVVFIVVGLYLEQVLPRDFGLTKHPLYCLRRKTKKTGERISEKRLQQLLEENYKTNDKVEEIDTSLKAQDEAFQSVIVNKLRKVYKGGKSAVNGLSLNIYQGQIFALLGHNGAGKTSTISMITGMIPISSGDIIINGMSMNTELEEIRKIMGFCPQHDILYDNLTVAEHLAMFATFKGMKKKDIPAAVHQIIEDLDLMDKKDYRAKGLSGGQRRRLSIGIAFIGGSKLILLDEPSSGMDTSSRRGLWEMLKKYKTGRTILLTTHFMDEADFLGDRIAIMGEGKLQACGRSLFLKNRFGVGYNLTLVKRSTSANSRSIIDHVLHAIPEATIVSDVSAEISMQLPMETVPRFKDLFDSLDDNKEKLNIADYGVSVTTLEEVFLKIANIDITTIDPNELNSVLFSPKEVFTPAVGGRKYKSRVDKSEYTRITQPMRLFFVHFVALLLKRFHHFKRDRRGVAYQILLPILMTLFGLIIMNATKVKNFYTLTLAPTLYSDEMSITQNTILDDGTTQVPLGLSSFGASYDVTKIATASIEDFDDEMYNQRDSISPATQYGLFLKKADDTSKIFQYSVLVNTTYLQAAPYSINTMNSQILRSTTGKSNLDIKVTFYPLPDTSTIKALKGKSTGLVAALIFSIGMSFIPSSIIAFVVKERQGQIKHQQLVSGVSLFAYWSSSFMMNIIEHLIPAVVCSLLVRAFSIALWLQDDVYGLIWALFVMFGFAVIPFCYVLSFVFKDHGSAQTTVFALNFITGFLFSLFTYILRIMGSAKNASMALQYIFRVFPGFAFSNGLINVSNRANFALLDGSLTKSPAWSSAIALWDVLYLAILGIVYFGILFLIENARNISCFKRIFTADRVAKRSTPDIDEDVERERIRIENSTEEFSVKVKNLRKVYSLGPNSQKVAVDDVSFGLQNGECFALLGVNGAGKTTTFKMLSGEYAPSSGSASIMGYDIFSQLDQARKYIGYCPQFDALLDNLTASEHLYLYAAIKGIPASKRKALVDEKLEEMALKKFENVMAGTYSGGNKRKLSVAIAMIGNPPIVFLDEPSTGMDPEARRFMWNVISRISTQRKRSSVILTTHSMEEAEALSTKMSIMVDGNIKCIGSIQHIKSKFGGGFEVEIKLNVASKDAINSVIDSHGWKSGNQLRSLMEVSEVLGILEAENLEEEISEKGAGSGLLNELNSTGKVLLDRIVEFVLIEKRGKELRNFLEGHFGKIHQIEHFQSFYRYKIHGVSRLGRLFGAIENNKTELDIMQYSIKQSSIEQIFNMFATGQIDVKMLQSTKKEPTTDTASTDADLLHQHREYIHEIELEIKPHPTELNENHNLPTIFRANTNDRVYPPKGVVSELSP